MATLEEPVEFMINHGSSLQLNWGEDNGCWEVSWITGGERFCGVSRDLREAMVVAIKAARDRYGHEVPVSGIG